MVIVVVGIPSIHVRTISISVTDVDQLAIRRAASFSGHAAEPREHRQICPDTLHHNVTGSSMDQGMIVIGKPIRWLAVVLETNRRFKIFTPDRPSIQGFTPLETRSLTGRAVASSASTTTLTFASNP